jgi:hypothetical protein
MDDTELYRTFYSHSELGRMDKFLADLREYFESKGNTPEHTTLLMAKHFLAIQAALTVYLSVETFIKDIEKLDDIPAMTRNELDNNLEVAETLFKYFTWKVKDPRFSEKIIENESVAQLCAADVRALKLEIFKRRRNL